MTNEERRTKNEERQRGTGNAGTAFVRARPVARRPSDLCPVLRSVVLRSVLSSSFFVLCSAGLGAQRGQPIYPAYDGFLKNPDGSYTLAFAYFSHNAEPVTIPPGTGNSFAPVPGDRQQPTVFKPGHWRFQCVMVVGPDFDGKMRWSVTYGGTTTGTSERMLQSNWNLLEGAAELARIDYAKAPRGVCLNRAPAVRLLGKTARKGEVSIDATTAEELHLFGSVADEGLPRGKDLTITWRMAKGPAPVTFSNPSAARTKASFTALGPYELELSATDSEFTTTLRVVANVK